MRKVILSISFFIFTPILILGSIFYFLFLSYNYKSHYTISQNSNNRVAFAALPTNENVLGNIINFKDARIEIVRQFFENYKSPLAPFAKNIVQDADKYGLDYKLLPAIAMQESNLCQKIIVDSYNCWGFGIYGKKITRFESYPEAIDTVTRALVKNYVTRGLTTPSEIMKKYTPSSNGSWAYGVSYFMSLLQ